MAEIRGSKGGIEEAVLAEHENKWGFRLPDEYRAFLLKYNGGWPEPGDFLFKGSTKGSDVLSFYGFGTQYDLEETIRVRGKRLPERFFPIGTDSGSNEICVSVSGEDKGKIYWWDHELEADPGQGESPETVDNIVLIADNFDEFISGLYEFQMT